jgi:radical SAM superfamily enzyme YgiQ (UPF0313 family)
MTPRTAEADQTKAEFGENGDGRHTLKVLLISAYDLGHQPFGLASPAAWLRARGHAVTTVDAAISPVPRQAVEEADWIAFHLPMHTATRLAAKLIARVRGENPAARLAAFGLYAPLNEGYLRRLGVAAVLGGEYEAALAEAIEGRAAPLVSLDRLPFLTPDRSTLPRLERYAKVRTPDGRRITAGYTEASRGCKHRCRHCPVVPVYDGALRIVPVEVVLEDVRRQAAAGAGHITFGDPDFLNGPGHALKVARALHAEFPEITWDAVVKVEHLLMHRDLLAGLKAAGCLWITSAVESTEDLVLEKLDKRHTRAGFLEALKATREAGLHLSPTFVPFTPWTTLEGYRDLLRVIVEQRLVDAVAPVQLALRLLLPAGSLLLSDPEVQAAIEPFDEAALLYRWHHPDRRVDSLAHAVFRQVASETKAGLPRREIFHQVWFTAHEGEPPPDFHLLARAAIPYLDEPWYC